METRSVRPEYTSSEFRSLVHSPLSLARQDLTYCKHFGFAELPFSITSDPQFFYSNAANEKILSTLAREIAEKGALVAVTGEPGTGKTTLLRRLINDSADRIDYIFIGVNARMSFIGLLREILEETGISSISTDRESLLEQLDDYLQERRAEDRGVALVFDEAQAISDEVLKELPLLCSSEGKGLMSIVLAGQPGLQGRLALLKSLKQRMTLTKRLTPLRKNDVAPYIALRLDKVGYQGEELFEPQAIERIADSSGGIPRLINALCDSALLRAYRASEYKVTAKMIDQVANELRLGGRLASMDQRSPAEMIQLRNLERAFLGSPVEAKETVDHLEQEENEVQPTSPIDQPTTVEQRAPAEMIQLRNLERAFLGPRVEAKETVDYPEHEEKEAQPTSPVSPSMSVDRKTPAEVIQLQDPERAFLAPVEAEEMFAPIKQEEKDQQTSPVDQSTSMDQLTPTARAQLRNLAKAFLGSQVKAAGRVADFVKEEGKSRLTEAAHKLKQLGEQLVQFSSVNRLRLAIGALMIVVASAWSYTMFHPQQRNITGPAVAQRDKNPPQKAGLVRLPAETALVENKATAKKPAPVSIPSLAVAEKSEKRNDLVAAKKPDASPSVSKAESRASEELYRVSGASFVRNKPTDSAEIIDTLQPGVRIAILNRSGEYFRVRSLGERSVSGFVHKEDAFFERIQ